VPNVQYIDTQSGLEKIIPELMALVVCGADCETTGLDPHKDKVTLMQIGNSAIQYVIDTRKVNIEPLRPFLESRTIKKVFHNAKFDYKMIKGTFGIDVEALRDTMIAEKILNVGRKPYGYGLDDCLKNHLEIEMDKSLQKSFIGHVGDYSREQIDYAGKDVEYIVDLVRKQSLIMGAEGLGDTFLVECGAISAFADMEFRGLLLDVDRWKEIIEQNLKDAHEIEDELRPMIAPLWKTNLFGEVDINFGSPQQVVELLQRFKIRVTEDVWVREKGKRVLKQLSFPIKDSKDSTLKKLKGYPVVDLIKRWRSKMIRVNTFGYPYINAIHPATGRIHPEFDQLGTETGRPASHKKSPVNMLNIPREKSMRNSFIAEPDYLVETDDYSGCELRIWAEISGDPNLMAPLIAGEDLHCAVATKLYRVPVTKDNENKHLRTPAKNLNFGIAYGMGAKKLCDDLNAAGFKISREDAKDLYTRYTQEEFKTGVDFLRAMGEQAFSEGFVANLNGRRRYWIRPNPDDREKFPNGSQDELYKNKVASIKREGGNSVIQSVNADFLKASMAAIRDHIKINKVRSSIINAPYDEIVTTTHKDDSPDFVLAKRKIMIDVAHRWLKKVPMEVDGHVLPYWTK
jgi:DNA polymerase-1